MDILALRATISEQALNDLAARHLPPDFPVEELRLQVSPEGLLIQGEYPLLVKVRFETLWELSVLEGKVLARLVSLRTLGLPMGPLKGVVMSVIASAAQKETWLAVDGDAIMVDIEQLLAREGLKARLNLTAIRCEGGVLLVEAGTAPPE
ncbi:MAG: hypothetical protein L0Z62_05220 [Gemmataceae bacterium]|nr:hypothetical protein [Gemmataceae bacterium]